MLRLLLCDDEVTFAESLAKVLRKRSMDVTTTYDGLSAVTLVEQGAFDAVVLDQRMPGIDGLETLGRIRKLNATVPVILLSGHAELPRVTAALKTGAAEYLLKPCPIDALVDAIEEAVERGSIHRQLGG